MLFVLLAPGPSMSQALADSVRGLHVGTVTSAFPLAPWADFLAATDMPFWKNYPGALQFAGRKFTPWHIPGTERVKSPLVKTCASSGVLALECAKRLGATRILLLGFDHQGTHYFGPYAKGLKNTRPDRRAIHAAQFAAWHRAHADIEVINCTAGSALTVFPTSTLEESITE